MRTLLLVSLWLPSAAVAADPNMPEDQPSDAPIDPSADPSDEPEPPATADPAAEPSEAVFTPPKLTQQVVPEYPEEARGQGLHGNVVIELDVGVDGQVHNAEVVDGPHAMLNLLALQAASKLKFEPATQDGEPVVVRIRYQFRFDLGLADEQGNAVPGSLNATVHDADGLPVPQADVRMRSMDDPDAEMIVTKTKDDGTFHANFLKSGAYMLRVEREGLAPLTVDFEISAGENVRRTFTMDEEDAYAIVVTYEQQTWREVKRGKLEPNEGTVTGSYVLTRRDIEANPGSLEDASRAIHTLPGIVSDGDMLASFNARGGETTDVVFMLDRVPLSNPYHLAGFNSLFNPDMIQRIDFNAGAAPADMPAATSAVMAVETWDGEERSEGSGFDGALDISASSLRAMLMGPVSDKSSVALAVRRSYLESYMQVMKWANVVDTAFVAPEYSEISARFAHRPNPQNRILLTWMLAGDSMAFKDSDDASVINFDGTFELRNNLSLLSVDHRYKPNETFTLQSTTAWTRDRSQQLRDFEGTLEHDVVLHRYFGRTDATISTDLHEAKAGVDMSWHLVQATGVMPDGRSQPTWHTGPMGDYATDTIPMDAEINYPEASAYIQETWKGTKKVPLKVRVGGRGSYNGLTKEVLLSPRAGVSLPLPTGTIPKASWGIYHRTPTQPLLFDKDLGNPDIQSETAMHYVVGVDQGFPLPGEDAGGMLRVEGYVIELNNLVVNPDNQAAVDAGTSWTNDGSGRNHGLDVLLAGQSGRVRGMVSYSYLVAKRTNPLNEVFAKEFAPAQDQRHTLSSSLEYQLTPTWRTTAKYSFHTGRPWSTVEAANDDQVRLSCLNCERMGNFHNVDFRLEWRKAMRNYRLSFYFELLNATFFQSDFVPTAQVKDGELTMGMFKHLPTRPFIGVRADF